MQSGEGLQGFAHRFGTSEEVLRRMNAELDLSVEDGSSLCVIPNSCSTADGVFQPWYFCVAGNKV